jgi:GTP cyclohydrolase I
MNVEVLPGREIPNQPGRLGDRTVGGRERDLTRERRRAGRSSLERGAEDPHLRVAPRPGIDLARAEVAVRALLEAVGADPSGEALRDTPRRVAHAYAELLTPRHFTLTTFPNDEGYDELVVARDIPFHSLCQHHLLPFVGWAHIGYLPGQRILGISKLARVVEMFARDLQVQEQLTQQVASWLQDHLSPRGVGVVLDAEHLCMSLRGVQTRGARTVTSALHGALRDDARTRQEFLSLTRPAR